MLAPHSVAALESGRALAGLCSGVVFGAATAWVRELSADVAISARRSTLALTAGFGTGPVVAALLAQWAPHPRVVPYLPHLAIGATAAIAILRVPETATQTAGHIRRWPPTAVRKPSFWLAIAPAAPWVFGSASLAFVVLPQEVTSANSLSVSFAGLMTALTLGSGLAIQTLARRIEGRRPLGASVAGLLCAAAGAGAGVAALAATSRPLAALSAVLFGASSTDSSWSRGCSRPSVDPTPTSAAPWSPSSTCSRMWVSPPRTSSRGSTRRSAGAGHSRRSRRLHC